MTQVIKVGCSSESKGDEPKGMVAKWIFNHFGCSTSVAEWLSTAMIAVISGVVVLVASYFGISIPVIV